MTNRIVLIVHEKKVPKFLKLLCGNSFPVIILTKNYPILIKTIMVVLVMTLYCIAPIGYLIFATGEWSWVHFQPKSQLLYKIITPLQLYNQIQTLVLNQPDDTLFASSVYKYIQTNHPSTADNNKADHTWKYIQQRQQTSSCLDCEDMYFEKIQNASLWNRVMKGERQVTKAEIL